MSGIASFVLFHVNKISVTFSDDIGNLKHISGTGFWLPRDGSSYFITNAHNIIPALKLGPDTKFQVEKFEIFLRKRKEDRWLFATYPCEVDLDKTRLGVHLSADVAIFSNVTFMSRATDLDYTCFSFDDLADQQFFASSLSPMDLASFIGFPGRKGIPWYDELWQMAIARTVNIASYPEISFSNRSIPTTDTMLVSGLSFSGSSGSPVISHEKGIKVGPGLSGGAYAPPKLIGLMSGHWWDEENPGDPLRHSGLSYLTRSTAILELLGRMPAI
jgi:hypothetical protein